MVVTIRDVAREAGVSSATVSRVFNDSSTVGEQYIDRVTRAAQSLGYRPNSLARNLRRQTSDVVALVVPDVGNSFHTILARAIEDQAQRAGYSVLLGNTDEKTDKEARYLEVAAMQHVAGVILCPHDAGVDIERLVAQHIPVVAIDRELSHPTDVVTSMSKVGAREATLHLFGQGWRRVACISGPREIETARDRADGYLDASAELGETPVVRYVNYSAEAGAESVRELLDSPEPPDAIFTANELLALGALTEIKRRGLEIGKDIGVVSFDDSPWAVLLDPPLSVVEQMPHEIAVAAAEMLIERLRATSDIAPRRVQLPTRLVVRGSSLKTP